MMYKKILTSFLCMLLLTGFVSQKKHYTIKHPPPGTLKLNTTTFIDQKEISNLNWLEYTWWMQYIFGKNSVEYKNCLPDTTVWSKLSNDFKHLDTSYFRNKKYRDYPVVGVTYEQTLNFCKWRSNRVFEYILIAEKKLDWNLKQNASNYFTIENYLTGNYIGIKPDSNYLYFPEFRLPTKEEWNAACDYNLKMITKKKTEKMQDNATSFFITPVFEEKQIKSKSKNIFFNLTGNVSEFLENNSTTNDMPAIDGYLKSTIDKTTLTAPNAYTGFRCACEWKKWENK